MSTTVDSRRYPIGLYEPAEPITEDIINANISNFKALPTDLRSETVGLTGKQLDTPYREGGWTIRQVIHHIPDSHMNGYIRFKWALTEDSPLIKAYFEERWAVLPDAKSADPEYSLHLLESIHNRWALLLESMIPAQFDRQYKHPETDQFHSLRWALGLYTWHGRHHLAHITSLKQRMGW